MHTGGSVVNITSIFKDRPALLILFTGLLVRGIVGAIVPPGFDEAYYGVYAFHPATGYFDHPPAVAVTAGIGYWLSGSLSAFSLRFGALALFLFSGAVLYSICSSLFSIRAGRLAILLLHTVPYFLLGMGTFVFPDNALGFFWLLFLYFLLKLQRTGDERWLIALGLSLGLGLLSKYHAVFLLAGFGWGLIFYRSWKKYWKSPYLYIGLLITLLCISPNIYWNYKHQWISYVYQFGKGTSWIEFSAQHFLRAILSQVGYLLPWNMVVLIAGVIYSLANKESGGRWLVPFAALPVLTLTAIGATRETMPHWTMPGYLSAIVITSGWMAIWRKRSIAWIISSSAAVLLLAIVTITAQCVTGILPLDKRTDVTLDGQGWREVVDTLRQRGFLDDDKAFLFTNKWFTSGELNYAAGPGHPVTVLNESAPQGFAFWLQTSALQGMDGVFVTTDRYPFDPRELYGDYFSDYSLVTTATTFRGTRQAQVFKIFRCTSLQRAFPVPYGIP
jgi:hypothetical protein